MEDLSDLDAAALLAAEEAGVRERRQGEVDSILRLLNWCDRHSVDPQTQPGAVPAKYGGDKLVSVGGEGTPQVSELCFEEFAIAGSAGVIATTNKAADALDLRHRLPNLFAAACALEIEPWVVRKVASMSRKLTLEQVEIVDLAVTAAVEESPSRVLAIAEAKVIEADIEAHRKRIEADAARKGVWLQRKRAGQRVEDVDGAPDVQGIGMRLSGAGAVEFNAAVNDVADALAAQYAPAEGEEPKTMDQFRADAVELLSRPHEAAAFLDGLADNEATHAAPAPKKRRPATIIVHLHDDVLSGRVRGVARVDGIGPLLLEQVTELLRHCEVTLQPVIDLNVGSSVNGYEHPTACKERTLLRATRDVFPHSSGRATSRLDHDHATPYDPNGPPGQTGDHNDAPLNRRDHRAKTHLGYRVRQLGLNAYRWETPHGLTRVVTGRGTAIVEPLLGNDRKVLGELYSSKFLLRYDGADLPIP